MMRADELGNFIMFRERGSMGSIEDVKRWAAKVVEYGFLAAACSAPEQTIQALSACGPDHFPGVHSHEVSNLIYGCGKADSAEERANRTLPECRESYLNRMAAFELVGQAMPLQHLDYAAGVKNVMSEIPASNATLVLAGARGAARAFGRTLWGVHAANYVTRCPVDEDTVRRLFILIWQSWLYGAAIIYDEEVALRYNHDTGYAFSDPIHTACRRFYQRLYHFGSAIELGESQVRIGFLHGNYDCIVGGAQAFPYIPATKVWGMIGPETEACEFNTSERGWEPISAFMPGVWLYPVRQDPRAIRVFLAGTPAGQVDLVPIDSGTANLSRYLLLVLPGWNTMTSGIHPSPVEYVRGGGHLVMCAAQCTEHVNRDFLLDKKDFRFFRGGDLSELAGVRVGEPEGMVKSIHFSGETISTDPGMPGLHTQLNGSERTSGVG